MPDITLAKAIEILTNLNDEDPELYRDNEQDALKLGIEALKRLQVNREQTIIEWVTLLPGEAKDA